MKKFASILLLLSVCMFTFAGCGDTKKTDTPPATSGDVETPEGDTDASKSEDTGDEKAPEAGGEEKAK